MKKGFTLIELVAVIALLGIIITLTSISVIKFKKNSEKKLCQEKEKYIITSAIKYGEEHLNSLNNSNDSHYKKCPFDNKYGYNITVGELIQLGYIVGDNNKTPSRLLIPGKPDGYDTSFNNKNVCIRYENIYNEIDPENGSYIDSQSSIHNYSDGYHGNTNYQVTARMNYSQCGSN